MHRYEIKLARNGTSTCITIPRGLMGYLGWLAGESVVVELTARQSIEIYPSRELRRVMAQARQAEVAAAPVIEP